MRIMRKLRNETTSQLNATPVNWTQWKLTRCGVDGEKSHVLSWRASNIPSFKKTDII